MPDSVWYEPDVEVDAGGMCGLATMYGNSGGSTPGGSGSPCSFSSRGRGGGEDGRGGVLGGRGGRSEGGGGGGGGGGGAVGGGGRGGNGGSTGLLVGLNAGDEETEGSKLLLTPAETNIIKVCFSSNNNLKSIEKYPELPGLHDA